MSDQILVSCPETRSFGKTSEGEISDKIASVKEGIQINNTSSVRRRPQKQYYLNGLERYRIGCSYNHNICYPKEINLEESGKYFLIYTRNINTI